MSENSARLILNDAMAELQRYAFHAPADSQRCARLCERIREVLADTAGHLPSAAPSLTGETPMTDKLIEQFRREKCFDVDEALDLARQLERELAEERAGYQRLFNRLNPSVEYVEGTPVGYGEDEIDRLEAQLRAVGQPSAAAPTLLRDPEIRWVSSAEGVHGHPTVGDLLEDAERQLTEDRDAAGHDERLKRLPLVSALLAGHSVVAGQMLPIDRWEVNVINRPNDYAELRHRKSQTGQWVTFEDHRRIVAAITASATGRTPEGKS